MLTQEVPVSCKEFIAQTIKTRGRKLVQSDGKVETVYFFGVMGEADGRRLKLQDQMGWSTSYKQSHNVLSEAGLSGSIGIIGVSGEAEQVRHVLEVHPQTKVKVIELDQKKYESAYALLQQTNPQDFASGRLKLTNEEAGEYLLGQPAQFDYIEADKVAIHLAVPLRQRLYQGIANALKPGGLFYKRDLLARTWRASIDEEHANDPSALAALKDLKDIMPKVLANTWTERGAPLWETIEDMSEEPMKYAPNLVYAPFFTEICYSDFRKGDHPEVLISQLIGIMPALGIELAKQAQPDNAHLAPEADRRWERAKRFVEAVETPGVLLALPDYNHLRYQKAAA